MPTGEGRSHRRASRNYSDIARGVVQAHRAIGRGHHDVLEPHAEAALDVDAGLDAERVARLRARARCPATMYGSSCASVPMPCPTRWTKFSPKPAAVITRRAAASTASHGVPTVAACTPASCASAQHRVDVAHLARRFTDVEHARDVGAVAVHRAAEVAQHELAVADDARRATVRDADSRRARRPRRSRSWRARARAPASGRRARDARRARFGPRTAASASRRPRRRPRSRPVAAPRSRRRPSPSGSGS